jgi:hypothetical protein
VPVDARLYEVNACQSNTVNAFDSFSEVDWAGFFGTLHRVGEVSEKSRRPTNQIKLTTDLSKPGEGSSA